MEIERKFLVSGDFKPFVTEQLPISQGYLCSGPDRTVRIRLQGERGYITIKGPSNLSGTSRYEWEKEISAQEARDLLELCEPGSIEKTRYLIPAGEHTFEVDEFYGENQGLILAEIELVTEQDEFEKPDWLGQEVTGDVRYYNARLMKNPYTKWKD